VLTSRGVVFARNAVDCAHARSRRQFVIISSKSLAIFVLPSWQGWSVFWRQDKVWPTN